MVDEDCSGRINFLEFLTTAVNPAELLTRDKIAKAFHDFDMDKSGNITIHEVNHFLVPDRKIRIDIWR